MSYEGPGTYQHYKGALYEVLGIALREDSIVKYASGSMDTHSAQRFVIYRPLTPGSLIGKPPFEDCWAWARDLDDFNETVAVTGVDRLPRFLKEKSAPVREDDHFKGSLEARPKTIIELILNGVLDDVLSDIEAATTRRHKVLRGIPECPICGELVEGGMPHKHGSLAIVYEDVPF